MPRISAMYAGSSGYSHSINRMAPGMCDNKWQGIAPTGQKRASVVRSIQRRGWGNNYTKVFCFNALSGGVGAKSAMFSPSATGASRNCQGSETTSLTGSEALQFLQTNQDDFVIFVPLDEVPTDIVPANFTHINDTVQADRFTYPFGSGTVYNYDVSPLTQLIYGQSITNTFTKNSTTYKAFYITESTSDISITSGTFNPPFGSNAVVGVTQFMS